jgi:hypothetical protein
MILMLLFVSVAMSCVFSTIFYFLASSIIIASVICRDDESDVSSGFVSFFLPFFSSVFFYRQNGKTT